MTRLEQQLRFLLEADKEKKIGRQTWLSDGSRKENDAEHAWHLALMVLLLGEHAREEIDLLKTLTMVLLHDIVEIDAGDTYAYDAAGQATAHEREQKAAERLYGLLPEDQGEKLRGLWEEFEARETPEAKFARTLDNFQPMMLNAAAQGKSWVEHGVRLSQVLRRNERTAEGSQQLWDHMREHYLAPNVDQGRLVDDTDGSWREG